jgi:hypothetical protein
MYHSLVLPLLKLIDGTFSKLVHSVLLRSEISKPYKIRISDVRHVFVHISTFYCFHSFEIEDVHVCLLEPFGIIHFR